MRLRKTHGHHWLPAEDAILRERWPRGGINAVREHLPHLSSWTIQYRVEKLGIHIERQNIIRRPSRPKGFDAVSMDVAFWFATQLLSTRPAVPTRDRIIERWNVSKATAYRWRRWASDKFEQIQARKGDHDADR
jgi:hypothetical protein